MFIHIESRPNGAFAFSQALCWFVYIVFGVKHCQELFTKTSHNGNLHTHPNLKNRKFRAHGAFRVERNAVAGIERCNLLLFEVGDGVGEAVSTLEDVKAADDARDAVVFQRFFGIFDHIADAAV